MCLAISVSLRILAAAQEPADSNATFGVTVVDPAGLKGEVYLLRQDSENLPDLDAKESIGAIYTPSLNVPLQHWLKGFPGVTDRFEWFAIDYHGNFWIGTAALYRFALMSDDGSRLWIDDQLTIDNDGVHRASTRFGSLRLTRGIHRIRVSYFQGPADKLGLVLQIAGPGEKYRVFSTNEFKPPRHPQDWEENVGAIAAPSPGIASSNVVSSNVVSSNVFSITSVAGAGLTGTIFRIPKKTRDLLSLTRMTGAGSFPSETVDIPSNEFLRRCVGRRGAVEPFALGFGGNFWIAQPGLYRFALNAHDGATLAVDGQAVGDNDQRNDTDFPSIKKYASVKLCSGAHRLEVQYFHAYAARAELSLEIARPRETFRSFRSADYDPPTNAESIAVSCE